MQTSSGTKTSDKRWRTSVTSTMMTSMSAAKHTTATMMTLRLQKLLGRQHTALQLPDDCDAFVEDRRQQKGGLQHRKTTCQLGAPRFLIHVHEEQDTFLHLSQTPSHSHARAQSHPRAHAKDCSGKNMPTNHLILTAQISSGMKKSGKGRCISATGVKSPSSFVVPAPSASVVKNSTTMTSTSAAKHTTSTTMTLNPSLILGSTTVGSHASAILSTLKVTDINLLLLIKRGADSARGDDAVSLKPAIALWLNESHPTGIGSIYVCFVPIIN
ncbi:hypothetical protein K503DRAFT_806357 [Rhizopogon vinicolor AM-OR11-026]|uniref:Uncharacterized protein n=1 Tax=Rhizopogon vinicolor AM-OR11-026 TaxID=1314800 RepID=A0A1B7MEV9_9AGAM|nr:hypothetical protein K503DRAFT_806357 [Rhizopogon vinicolor AM-OR11-026]